MIPSFGKAIRKHLKVNPVSLGTNEHSTMGSGMAPLTPEEEAWYQQEIEGIYDDFVSVVADGRKVTKEYVDSIAQGRVWAGKDALRIKLADEKATVLEAVQYAAERAGLENYRIQMVPEVKSMFQQIMDGDSKKKDEPLVKDLLHPGFNAIARMPYITIDTPNSILK